MLQAMRKLTRSWISTVFLSLIAGSFVVWGIADVFRGSTDTNVVTVGSTQVPVESFRRDFQNAMRNAGAVLAPGEAKALGQQVLDRMTASIALDNLTDSLGLTATDGRVRQQIQAISAFNGPMGGFDHDTFVRIIRDAGYSEEEFVAVSRKDVARGQLLHAVEGGYQMPPDYARAIFAYINETRTVEYVALTPSSLAPIAPPSETVLADYVKAHPERFSTPEYRSVSYAWVATADLAPSQVVTDKQIQQEIDANRSTYITPEKRTLEQISFKSESEAIAAKAALDGGKTFDALAAERHLQAADYKLGDVAEADLAIDPPRAKAAFALAEGGVSAPVKGNFGWALLHVTKITPGVSKSNDEIKLIIQRKLAQSKMADMSNAYIDAVADGDSVEQAARKAGMHYVRVAATDAQGLAPGGNTAIAGANPDLMAAIFKAEVGEDADPFPTKDGSYLYAVAVDGITPPKTKPVSAVREQAIARWTEEQRQAQLKTKATALAAKATADKALDAVAASLGAPVSTSPVLTRRSNEGVFDAALVHALFEAAPGTAISFPGGNGGYIVARIAGVRHAPVPDNTLQYVQGVMGLSQEISGDVTMGLAKAEQAREHVTVNQKLVDSTVGGNSGSGS